MKINEVLTSKAKIMEAGLDMKAIIKDYVENNPNVNQFTKKVVTKDLTQKLQKLKGAEKQAELRKLVDATNEFKKPNNPEPTAQADQTPDLSSEELKGELKNAQTQFTKTEQELQRLNRANQAEGPVYDEYVLQNRMAKARVDAISNVSDGKNAYTTDDVKQLRNVLRALAKSKTNDIAPKTALNTIYNGLPKQDVIVSNLISKVWPNVKKASASNTEIDRDAYGTGDEQGLTTDAVRNQGAMALELLDARGIEYDDNQKRAIQSGRIASEVRIVADYGNGKGLLETPLGVLEGEIQPFKVKGMGDVGEYAESVINIKAVPTNDSYEGRGYYSGIRDVAPLNSNKNVSVKYGNKQIRGVDDSHSVSMTKPLRLKGSKSANRTIPKAAMEYMDSKMDDFMKNNKEYKQDKKDHGNSDGKSGSDYYSDFKKQFGY